MKFLEKGFSNVDLDKAFNEVAVMDRAVMLKGRDKSGNNDNVHNFSMITTYSQQHYDIKKIMKKHWALLINNKILGPVLPEHPQVIFRGVPPLEMQRAPNVLDAPNRVSFFQNSKFFFSCHRCTVCHINKNKRHKNVIPLQECITLTLV